MKLCELLFMAEWEREERSLEKHMFMWVWCRGYRFSIIQIELLASFIWAVSDHLGISCGLYSLPQWSELTRELWTMTFTLTLLSSLYLSVLVMVERRNMFLMSLWNSIFSFHLYYVDIPFDWVSPLDYVQFSPLAPGAPVVQVVKNVKHHSVTQNHLLDSKVTVTRKILSIKILNNECNMITGGFHFLAKFNFIWETAIVSSQCHTV